MVRSLPLGSLSERFLSREPLLQDNQYSTALPTGPFSFYRLLRLSAIASDGGSESGNRHNA